MPLLSAELIHEHRLRREARAMLMYFADTGKSVPPELTGRVAALHGAAAGRGENEAAPKEELQELLDVHFALAELCKPATPASLLTTQTWFIFIRNPAIIMISVFAAFSMITFVGINWFGMHEWFFGQPATETVYDIGEVTLTVREVGSILSAAGIGSAFHGLWAARPYIRDRSFEPRYNQVYLTRFLLGVIAGSVVGLFGFVQLIGSSESETASGLATLGVDTLALLGGYSAEAVAKMLKRLSDTLVTAVQGDQAEQAEATIERATTAHQAERLQDHVELIRKLEKLRTGDPAAVHDALEEISREASEAIDAIKSSTSAD
ncbi:MAG: hypothetical protein AAGI17_05635 [Planctomycetota bacterium]